MSIYEILIVDKAEFPFTLEGLIINPHKHSFFDENWKNSLVKAMFIFSNLEFLIQSPIYDEIESRTHAEVIVRRYPNMLNKNWASIQYLSNILQDNRAFTVPQRVRLYVDAAIEYKYALDNKENPTPAEPDYKDDRGYVYLIQSPTGYYKIGKTKKPRQQVKDLFCKIAF